MEAGSDSRHRPKGLQRRGSHAYRRPVRTLTLRELNRATLARQLLLRRHGLPLVRAVERVGGLQGQWPPAPYVGLWSRLDGFRRETLELALRQQRILKATVMRTTLHLVSARDYALFTAALDGGRALGLRDAEVTFGERFGARAREYLAEGPASRREIFDRLEQEFGIGEPDALFLSFYAVRIRGRIVHSPESAFWKAPQRMRFVALDGVLLPDVLTARVELVRRYLSAFGPATPADLRQWTGMRGRDLASALQALEPLRRFRDEAGRVLLDLPRAPLPPADTPAPVRLLPRFDNLLLSHDDRRRVLPEEYRRTIIQGGMVEQAFLADGFVAGMWSLEHGRVRIAPFAPLPRATRRELEGEAARLEAFVRASSG
jgi:hypothetical protein